MLRRLILFLSLSVCLNATASADDIPITIYAAELAPYIVPAADGTPTGLMVDIVLEASKRAKLSVNIKIVPWARAYKLVLNGHGLGLMAAERTPERERLFWYGEQPILRYNIVWIKRRDASIVWDGSVKSVSQHRIIRIRDALTSPLIDDALKSGVLHAHEVDSLQNGLEMLAINHADLFPMPQTSGRRMIQELGLGAKVEVLEPPITAQPAYLAFSRDTASAAILVSLDKALKEMWSDGSISARSAKYGDIKLK